MPNSFAYNMDCMEYMRTLPDGYFDLIIADPPYGDAMQTTDTEHRNQRWRIDKYNQTDEQALPTYNRFGGQGSLFEKYKREATVARPDGSSAQKQKGSRERERERERERTDAVARTGGTWAEKYGKKS